MKIEFHTKDVLFTSKQKAQFEKKIAKLKKYIKDETTKIDVFFKDESGAEKGGVDQAVEISTVLHGQKVFVREVDDRLNRAFAYAFKSFERQIGRIHGKLVEKPRKVSREYFDKALKVLRLKK